MPVILFVEVLGKVGTASPSQIEALVPNENVGVMVGSIVTVSVVPLTQPPEVGVKV